MDCGSPGGGSTFAFATTITNPLLWASSYCYDYLLGRPLTSIDVNSLVSETSYRNPGDPSHLDLLDRPSSGDAAHGAAGLERKTSVHYTDTPDALQIETQSDPEALGDAAGDRAR